MKNHFMIGFTYLDGDNPQRFSANSVISKSKRDDTLFDIGEQFNTFLKQIGYMRQNDYIFMEDVSEEEYRFLHAMLKRYRHKLIDVSTFETAIRFVINYFEERFSNKEHGESYWVMPDGSAVTEDVGYAAGWWFDCAVKELKQFLSKGE